MNANTIDTWVLDTADRIAHAHRSDLAGRSDAANGKFIAEMLRGTLTQIYETKYPNTPWADGTLISYDTTTHEGAEQWQYGMASYTGAAKITAEGATDIASADYGLDRTLLRIRPMPTKVAYTSQQMRAAAMSGDAFNVGRRLSMAASRGFAEGLDNIVRTGDDTWGFQGVTNADDILTLTAGAAWSGATPAQIRADVDAAVSLIASGSSDTLMPDTCVMSRASNLILRRNAGTGTDTTVLRQLQEAYPEITQWAVDDKIKTAGAGGNDCVLFYSRDPSRLQGCIPMRMRPTAPQTLGLTTQVIFESRVGELAIPQPKNICRLDGV